MSSFPLFRVPHVVFSQIVNSFDLSVIVISSFCSKRMHRLIKVFRRKVGKLRIELYYHRLVELDIERNGEELRLIILPPLQSSERLYDVTMGNHSKVPVSLSNSEKLWLHFDDDFEGIKEISAYITDLFSAPIKKIIPDAFRHPDGTRRIINWILKWQGKIERCLIVCDKMTDTENAYALSHCKFMKSSFFMKSNYGPHFQHDFEYDGEYLDLKNCPWFSLNNLLTLNPRYYYVWGTRLTSSDINIFLKRWIGGIDSQLEDLKITMERIDRAVLLEGIEVVERDASVQRIFKKCSGKEETIYGGLDITNGKVTATISDDLTDQTYFWMIVWR